MTDQELAWQVGSLTEQLRATKRQLEVAEQRLEEERLSRQVRLEALGHPEGPEEQDWSWVTQDMLEEALADALQDAGVKSEYLAKELALDSGAGGLLLEHFAADVCSMLATSGRFDDEPRCPTCGRRLVAILDHEIADLVAEGVSPDYHCPVDLCGLYQRQQQRMGRGRDW